MKRLRLATLILATMLISGCIPIHVTWIDWPDIDGRVIDVTTRKPIAGAALAIHAATADFSASTTTAADGTFHFSRQTHDAWVQSDFHNVFPPAMISVTAPGYDRFENRLDGSMSVEAIPLTPVR
ncbi:MAG TPA: hypothetical protein VH722_08890 [Alphaproteobacteria bacterium]|jgi:hypothetical protein|nr:hypothetical protein [Alphaproteobacteria bacterium]